GQGRCRSCGTASRASPGSSSASGDASRARAR
ncbi:MAG: hypothetical protein AVDCRST_MAG40-1853, partial [uncultured Gemmatimonadaceae bacterium]